MSTTMLPIMSIVTSVAMTVAAPGTAIRTSSHWVGDVIVTDVDVRLANGELVRVTQLGGIVDRIGMRYSDQPELAQPGAEVWIGDGAMVVGPGAYVAAGNGDASYGVQRTTLSKVPLHHGDGCIAVALDTTTLPAAAQPTIEQAFRTWETATAQCGGIVFELGRIANAAPSTEYSVVHLRSDRWCAPATPTTPEVCFTPGAAAVTRLTYVDSPGQDDDGTILAADVELNAVDFELLLPGAAPATTKPALDLQSVATHEVGHLLGLAHDCGTGLEPWPTDQLGRRVPACDPASELARSTMYYVIEPNDLTARIPAANDVEGACSIASALTCDESTVTGGCAATRRTSLAPVLAALAACLRRRRRMS